MSAKPGADAHRFVRAGLVALALISVASAAVALWRYRHSDDEPTSIAETVHELAQLKDDTPGADIGYVGSAVCAECHRQIAESYKSHPMSRSIAAIDAESEHAAGGNFNSPVIGRQRVYHVEFKNGVMEHHERTFDASGELIYDQAVPMDYVVGSGRRGKAYIYHRGNLLYMSPLNWYSATQSWDLAPGYKDDDPRRFDRRITEECLSCHAGRVASLLRGSNAFERPAFHEMSIGCENCHGPGDEHVKHHRMGRAASSQDPIVNPARLDVGRRESVCYQCHLQAAARLPRYRRSDLDFRPGQSFEETWTALDAGSDVSDDGKTVAVNHVQQMRESRCYVASQGQLGCISCHDPHRVPAESQRDAFYRERCFGCHNDGSCKLPVAAREVEKNSCIACHMPARGASNVAHVTQTDHRVIRSAQTLQVIEAKDEIDSLAFFDDAHLRLQDWEQKRALGLGARKYLSMKGRRPDRELARSLALVLERVPDDSPTLIALGSMAQQYGLAMRARDYYEQALRIPAAEEAALSGLLDLDYFAKDWQNVLVRARRLIEIDPGDARVYAMQSVALWNVGQHEQGIDAANRALQLNPTLMSVREWLAEAYGRSGRADEEREQRNLLERLKTARPPRTMEPR